MSNSYTDEDIERCTLTGSREILFQLRSLIKHSERVSVTFDESRQSFLTVLIDVLADEDQLIFDIGGSEETNRAFLKADRCLFAGVLEGIRIQFHARQARMTKINGEQVFTVPLPKNILRLQRRDAFRLHLPTIKPYICRVRRGSAEEKTLPLRDISVGGIGIQVAEQLAYDPLTQLENSWIDLRESGMFAVTLEVRYIMSTEARTGKPLWHMGCRFLNLSPHDETLIQRFMARVEAERRALSSE